MCKFLKVSRGTVYYKLNEKAVENELSDRVTEIFKKSKNNYGTRKIKIELSKLDMQVSRRKISRIMKNCGLVSNYTIKRFEQKNKNINNDSVENIVAREFDNRKELEVVVSDLTYVDVSGKWNYICILLDLYNREIIGYSAGEHKDSKLVEEAFKSVKIPLKSIGIFHTDRGSEFKNSSIDEILKKNKIRRSLSKKGCPYDNSVAEATYKIFKTEFIRKKKFSSIESLKLKLFEYVNWYNSVRIHSSLGYLTPNEYKKKNRNIG